jgi:hypothetical protein
MTSRLVVRPIVIMSLGRRENSKHPLADNALYRPEIGKLHRRRFSSEKTLAEFCPELIPKGGIRFVLGAMGGGLGGGDSRRIVSATVA